MKQYGEMARIYFLELEGLHLYPSIYNPWLWIWIATTVLWLVALTYFAVYGQATLSFGELSIVALLELAWFAVTARIHDLKKEQLVATTNDRYGMQLKSASECRQYLLSRLTKSQSSEFLKVAKEIDDLMALKRKFQNNAELVASEFWKNIYDKDSKARLLTLMIAIASVVVALAARSDATLDTIFEAFMDPGYRSFVIALAIFTAILFLVFIGVRILFSMVMDIFVSWRLKIFSRVAFTEWLLSYLVRDLIHFHSTDWTNHEITRSKSHIAI